MVGVSAVQPATAQHRAVPLVDDSVSIEFSDPGSSDGHLTAAGNDAWLDLNRIADNGKSRERRIRVLRRFAVRVVRQGSIAGGSATLTARLDSDDRRATYRIDGHPLSRVPFTVDAHVPIGKLEVHTLEIDVPASAPEGPLAASITWEVTTDS